MVKNQNQICETCVCSLLHTVGTFTMSKYFMYVVPPSHQHNQKTALMFILILIINCPLTVLARLTLLLTADYSLCIQRTHSLH